MGDFTILASRIKELRNKLELKQSEFAKNICTSATLSAYENGSKSPSLEIVKNIATKYNVSLDWLCGLSDKENINEDCTTYSDIIKMLLVIEKYLDITITLTPGPSFDGVPRAFGEIVFNNETMVDFLIDWEKIKELHDANTIDNELYNLWVEKTLNKYDTTLARGKGWNDIPEPQKNS